MRLVISCAFDVWGDLDGEENISTTFYRETSIFIRVHILQMEYIPIWMDTRAKSDCIFGGDEMNICWGQNKHLSNSLWKKGDKMNAVSICNYDRSAKISIIFCFCLLNFNFIMSSYFEPFFLAELVFSPHQKSGSTEFRCFSIFPCFSQTYLSKLCLVLHKSTKL